METKEMDTKTAIKRIHKDLEKIMSEWQKDGMLSSDALGGSITTLLICLFRSTKNHLRATAFVGECTMTACEICIDKEKEEVTT